MLVVGKFTRQTKFNPIVRFDPKDPDAIEVRVDGYDTISMSFTREQYNQFRAAVGKFTASAPAPRPTPPPAPEGGDDGWSN
jgi:hypothetical protein